MGAQHVCRAPFSRETAVFVLRQAQSAKVRCFQGVLEVRCVRQRPENASYRESTRKLCINIPILGYIAVS